MASPVKFWPEGVRNMQMTDVQSVVASVAAVTSEGNPATLDIAPVWSSSDPSIVLVEASPDGMQCVISSPSPGPLGSAVVTVAAQIDGEDVTATLAVDIIASDAVALSITTGEPKP